MALDLTAEQKELGKGNANAAAYDLTRRGFMKSMAIGGAAFGTVRLPPTSATRPGRASP